MATTISKTDPLTEQIKTIFTKLLAEAEATDSVDALWLTKLIEVSNSAGGRLYRCTSAESPIVLASKGSLDFQASATAPIPAHCRPILRHVCTTKRPHSIVVSADDAPDSRSQPSLFYAPVIVDGQAWGAVELQSTVGASAESVRESLRVACIATDCYAERQQRLGRRKQEWRRLLLDEVERFVPAVHEKLSVAHAAYVVVNDGRKIIGCDRLTILLGRKGRYWITAASGVDEIEPRSQAAKLLVRLATPVAATGEPLYFQGRSDDLAPQIRDALSDYLDETYVKEITVIPLVPPTPTAVDETQSVRRRNQPPIGVLVMEWFESVSAKEGRRERAEMVSQHAALAVAKAWEHESIPLLPLWKACAGIGRLFAPGVRVKTYAALVAAVAAVAALCLIPTDFVLHARGTLQPQLRRHVFAPHDGTVKAIYVRHGESVIAGQLLLELNNTDLEVSLADTVGERTVAAEQLLATELALFERASRLAPKERQELAGRRSELQQKLAGLDEQIKLLQRKRAALRIVSPIAGEVATWEVDQLLRDRPVRQGQTLLDVAESSGPWELELRVPESGIGRLLAAQAEQGESLRVSYRLASEPRTDRSAVVREVQHAAEVRDEEGNLVLAKANLGTDPLPMLRPGAEATAKIYCGRCSLGYAWLHDAVDFVRMKIWFRLY